MRALPRALCIGSVTLAVAVGCAASGSTGSSGFLPDDAGADTTTALGDAKLPDPVDASSILDSGCATATAPIERDPIYMLIVLDGSGSMSNDDKWSASVPAIGGLIDTIHDLKDRSFGLGLTIFSDVADTSDGGAGSYSKMDVPIAYVDDAQANALHARLNAASPKGQTPTYEVLSGQYPLVEAYTPTPPLLPNGKKVLVLMTDGVPWPDPGGTEKPQCISAATAEFAKTAPAGPVITFAVGIGYTFPYDPQIYDPKFVAQLALAGGAPNQPCDPEELSNPNNMCHFQVTPTGGQNGTSSLEIALLVAFDKIRARVTSCELTLDKSGIVDPTKVNVVFTDSAGVQQVVAEDPVDGWTYDDPSNPSKVVLHGKSCDDLKANPFGNVVVVLGCATIVR